MIGLIAILFSDLFCRLLFTCCYWLFSQDKTMRYSCNWRKCGSLKRCEQLQEIWKSHIVIFRKKSSILYSYVIRTPQSKYHINRFFNVTGSLKAQIEQCFFFFYRISSNIGKNRLRKAIGLCQEVVTWSHISKVFLHFTCFNNHNHLFMLLTSSKGHSSSDEERPLLEVDNMKRWMIVKSAWSEEKLLKYEIK